MKIGVRLYSDRGTLQGRYLKGGRSDDFNVFWNIFLSIVGWSGEAVEG